MNPIKVVFLLGKDLNDQKTVNKIRFANSSDWYLFQADHTSIDCHQILQSRIESMEYESNAELEWFLSDKTKRIYLNAKNQFVYGRRLLMNEKDLFYQNIQNQSILQNNLTNMNTNNLPNLPYMNTNPATITLSTLNANNLNLATNPINNLTNNSMNNLKNNKTIEIELEKFDYDDDPFEFMAKFEEKYKNVKSNSRFIKLKNYLPEAEHSFVTKSSYRMTWNNFVEHFLKTFGERYRRLIKNLDRSKFIIGGKINLMEFVNKKFELYEHHLKGTPEYVQIIQIINSLPDEYAKKLYFNVDKNKEDFLERVQFVHLDDSEDEYEESCDNQENVNQQATTQSATTKTSTGTQTNIEIETNCDQNNNLNTYEANLVHVQPEKIQKQSSPNQIQVNLDQLNLNKIPVQQNESNGKQLNGNKLNGNQLINSLASSPVKNNLDNQLIDIEDDSREANLNDNNRPIDKKESPSKTNLNDNHLIAINDSKKTISKNQIIIKRERLLTNLNGNQLVNLNSSNDDEIFIIDDEPQTSQIMEPQTSQIMEPQASQLMARKVKRKYELLKRRQLEAAKRTRLD